MILDVRNSSKELVYEVISNNRSPVGYIDIQFADGIERMFIRLALLHMPMWELLHKLNVTITKEHIVHDGGPFSIRHLLSILNVAYASIIYNNPGPETMDTLVDELWDIINFYDDLGCNELNEYHCSVDLIGMSKIMNHPLMEPIVRQDINEDLGTMYIENEIANRTMKLNATLSSRTKIPNNILIDYIETNMVNQNQLAQVFISYGLRTEVNDVIIPKLIKGSSLAGVNDITEWSLECQGARKAAYYQRSAIRTAQHANRIFQIACAPIKNFYTGDCGSTVYLPWDITEESKNYVLGRYIATKKGLLLLTDLNVNNFIGKTVMLRSPELCRHTDGVCATCFGLLHLNYPPNINVGMSCVTEVISPVSQLVLSTKHFIKTATKLYTIYREASDYIEHGANGLYFTSTVTNAEKPLVMGVPISNIRGGSITDLLHLSDGLKIPEERYSSLDVIYLKSADGDIAEIPLVLDKQTPFLSKEFLMYIKDVYDHITIEKNTVWIPLDKKLNSTFTEIPVFRTTIENDSMMAFVMKVTGFLKNGAIAKYKDAREALLGFSELVHSKVSVPLVILEVILRAHMVVSEHDSSVPIVEDYTKVTFKKTDNIIEARSISGEMAFQMFKKYVSTPSTYVNPRSPGVYDPFFGIH